MTIGTLGHVLRTFGVGLDVQIAPLNMPSQAESKLLSRNCRSYWNLEVSARVPRLESSYVYICKLQPVYFVKGNFWRGLHCDWWNFTKYIIIHIHNNVLWN
jgi:hypothetical protein